MVDYPNIINVHSTRHSDALHRIRDAKPVPSGKWGTNARPLKQRSVSVPVFINPFSGGLLPALVQF